MSGLPLSETADGFWVLGDRWTYNTTHRSWPRVYGPYYDYPTACASARELNALDGDLVYVVLVAGPETPIEPRRARGG